MLGKEGDGGFVIRLGVVRICVDVVPWIISLVQGLQSRIFLSKS